MIPPVVRVGRGKAGGRSSVMGVLYAQDGNLTVLEHLLFFSSIVEDGWMALGP